MKMSRFTAMTMVLLIALVAGKAMAADYQIDISNNTGYTIMFMYVSPADAQSWEEDVLGDEVLPDGVARRITLSNYNSPMFDVRLVDEDGDTYTFWNVDVSQRDLVVTLDDLDISD